MSALDALGRVARGEAPANGALLQNCRMEAFGTGFYGEEAILEAFRARPCEIAPGADVVAGRAHGALFGADWALFADLYDGNIGRIWYIGPGRPAAREPALAVPFDPDLAQARGGVFRRGEDHPELPASVIAPLSTWAQSELVAAGGAAYRTRAFLVRAFADVDNTAALFAVHHLGPGPVRTAGFSYAAARFRLAEGALTGARLIEDGAGIAGAQEAAWRPRL